jgi:hypothetical protein
MNLPNMPELNAEQAKILAAIRAGKSPDEIYANLRHHGIVTTLNRVEAFCRAIPPLPSGSDIPPVIEACFPELDAVRPVIVSLLKSGFKPSEIRELLADQCKIQTTEERVRTYFEGLLNELYPAGPIQRSLFEVIPSGQNWDEDAMVLPFGPDDVPDEQKDGWTVRDLSEGVGVFGGTGSGKTSGSGRTLLMEMLIQGYGGLVVTTKKEEASEMMKLAIAANRAADVSIIRHDGPLRLNFLQYEVERPGPGSEFTETLVEFFKNLLSVVGSQKAQADNQNFWKNTGNQLLRNTVTCFLLAKKPLTLDNLCKFITAAPTSEEAAAEYKWPIIPVFGECLASARDNVATADDARVYKILEEYWLTAYPTLAPETRSCITIALTAMLDALRARHTRVWGSGLMRQTPRCIYFDRSFVHRDRLRLARLPNLSDWIHLTLRRPVF